MFKLTCCIMYTSGVRSRNCGENTKAKSTSEIAETCRTTEATSAEGLLGDSGCNENSVMVREDLIRRMNPSPVGCLLMLCSGTRLVSAGADIP